MPLHDPVDTPVEEEHATVAASAPVTRWDGTRLHLDYAVAVLAPGLTSVGRPHDPWAA